MNVKFDLIRYANCWEDADILLNGLKVTEGSCVLSIASAGDNSFSLLTANPEKVTAVDISNVQLYLVELKKVAIQSFEYEEFLSFIGVVSCAKRVAYYQSIRSLLSTDARNYWDNNLILIQNGLIYAGKFEKYFSVFRKWILPLIHSQKDIYTLFEKKNNLDQKYFYQHTWNNKRWKALFAMFFNKYVMGKYGRDPEFLKQVQVSVSDFIYSKAEKQLASTLSQENYFLKMILKGKFESELPHYLREENFKIIKSNIARLEIKQGFVQDVLTSDYQYFNLSNIFEYMPLEIFKQCVSHFNEKSPSGSRFAYWNLMVPRQLSKTFHAQYQFDETSKSLTNMDKGFFYNKFIVDQKI